MNKTTSSFGLFSRVSLLLAVALATLSFACSAAEGTGAASSALQDECVREHTELPQHLADGEKCYAYGFGRCQGQASECNNVCAHDMCQAEECTSDADCAQYGAGTRCESYVSSGKSYGKWCNPSHRKSSGRSTNTCVQDCYEAGGSNCSSLCKNI